MKFSKMDMIVSKSFGAGGRLQCPFDELAGVYRKRHPH